MGEWRQIRGDGTDKLPLWTWYDARRRDGRIERDCQVTPLCAYLGADLFRHHNLPRDNIAIRVLEVTP